MSNCAAQVSNDVDFSYSELSTINTEEQETHCILIQNHLHHW